MALFFCPSLQGALIRRPAFTLCCYPWWPGKASPVMEGRKDGPRVSGGDPRDSTPHPQEDGRKLGGSGSPFGRTSPPGTPGNGPRKPRWWPGRGALGGEPGLTAGGPPQGSLFAGRARWLVYNLGTVEQEVWSQPAAQRASLACDSPPPTASPAVSFPCLLAWSPSGQGPGLSYSCIPHQGEAWSRVQIRTLWPACRSLRPVLIASRELALRHTPGSLGPDSLSRTAPQGVCPSAGGRMDTHDDSHKGTQLSNLRRVTDNSGRRQPGCRTPWAHTTPLTWRFPGDV